MKKLLAVELSVDQNKLSIVHAYTDILKETPTRIEIGRFSKDLIVNCRNQIKRTELDRVMFNELLDLGKNARTVSFIKLCIWVVVEAEDEFLVEDLIALLKKSAQKELELRRDSLKNMYSKLVF